MLEALIFVIFPFCMVFAAVSDALSMTIANRVSLVLVGSFIVIAPLTGMEWSAVGMHVAAGALVLSATFMLFAIGGMGGGDAKLMAATAVWMGFDILLLEYLLYASFVGGVLTFATLMYRKSFLADFTRNNMFLRHFADTRVGIPYGVALGFAGLMIYPKTSLVLWAMARLAG